MRYEVRAKDGKLLGTLRADKSYPPGPIRMVSMPKVHPPANLYGPQIVSYMNIKEAVVERFDVMLSVGATHVPTLWLLKGTMAGVKGFWRA